MKKTTKLIYFLLVLVLVIAMPLAGCKKQEASEESPTSAPTTADTTEAEPTEEPEPELEPYEIHAVLFSSERNDKQQIEEAMDELLTEKINSTIKFTFIPSANWTQQTNLMIASNEKVDILWTSSFFGYSTVVGNGQVLPLNDLINNYGDAVVDVLGWDVLDACKIGGEVYGIPSTRDMAADYGVIMRKDLVDEYSLDLASVNTMEDLSPLWAAVQQNNLDITPTGGFTGTNTMVGLVSKGTFDYLDNWFGVIRLDDPDCSVIDLYETPEYAEWCAIAREWYVDGYIAADAATSTASAWDLIRSGKQFSVFYSFKPGAEVQEKRRTGYDMTSVKVTPAVQTTSTITVMMASVARTSDNPERTMMLLNLWYGDADLVNLFDNGIEGVHYVMGDDGFITLPEGVEANTGWPSNNYLIGNNYLSYLWEGYDADNWEQMKVFNTTAVKSPALGFSFDAKPVETEVAAVSNVVLEYRSGLETGTLDPEVKLPEFIQKLKDAGIDTIIAEKQKQLDEWLASK